MNRELEALLIVQQDDEIIRGIEARRDAFAPRLAALDKARQRANDEVTRNEQGLERELDRLHALEARMAEHRLRHEKNVAVLDQAHKLKEATAAMAQVEAARRVLADEESELLALTRRIADLRAAVTAARELVVAMEAEQAETRAAIKREQDTIGAELAQAQAKRASSAEGVSRALLSKYDRVQLRRKSAALFALHADFSCGSCDTAVSRQQRPALMGGQSIEVCEGCGVLLYLPVAPTAG